MSTPSVTALMTLAATAEQQSEHPLALAIMQSAREKFKVSPMPLAEHATVSFVGSGVSCECSLGHILVGNRTFMKTQGVNFSSVADSAMWTLETQGKVCFLVFPHVVVEAFIVIFVYRLRFALLLIKIFKEFLEFATK